MGSMDRKVTVCVKGGGRTRIRTSPSTQVSSEPPIDFGSRFVLAPSKLSRSSHKGKTS